MNAVVEQRKPNPLHPQTFTELVQFANLAAKTKMVPPQYQNQPESIVLAVQMGAELGLAPMQSLQNIAVIQGRPAVFGDAVIGLCRQSPICQDVVESFTGEGDKTTASCTAYRVGSQPITRTFSVEDAKKAGLWGKPGPWQQYPRRMLQMRARGFAVRDAFPDVLRGLITAEEARDMRPQRGPYPGLMLEGETTPEAAIAPEPTPETKAAAPDLILTRPASPDRQTAWLDKLELELAQAIATGPEAVDAILARADVQAAQDRARNGHKDRLDGMLQDAIQRSNAAETSAPNDSLYANPDEDPFREYETNNERETSEHGRS